MIKRTLEQAQELDKIMQKADLKQGIVLNNVRKGEENYRIYKLCLLIDKETGFLKQVPNRTDFTYLALHAMESTGNKPFEKMYYDDLAEKGRKESIEKSKTCREWITIIISTLSLIASGYAIWNSNNISGEMRGEIDSISVKSTINYLKMIRPDNGNNGHYKTDNGHN